MSLLVAYFMSLQLDATAARDAAIDYTRICSEYKAELTRGDTYAADLTTDLGNYTLEDYGIQTQFEDLCL